MATQLNGSPREEATSKVAPIPFITRSNTVESQAFVDALETSEEQAAAAQTQGTRLLRSGTDATMTSTVSVPPPGSLLTGKQEHYLKRELISAQTQWEVSELSHPTALQRFGAPFRSDRGEVAPEDSELPLLRYIFVHHVRNFPFLNQAKEKEFWQDKLQSFLESFANKHISSAEDRLEQTKRAKLAQKANKLVELMMVSGIPTASGYEERIRFSEMEVVESGPNEDGLVVNVPEGHEINGWDVNVAGVRLVSVKRHVRQHKHAEFLLRVKRRDEPERYVARRFGDFARMHKKLRLELPGKVLPPLPKKNKAQSLYSGKDDDDSDSVSSMSTTGTGTPTTTEASESNTSSSGGFRSYLSSWTGGGASSRHVRNTSKTSLAAPTASPRASMDSSAGVIQSTARESAPQDTVLHREDQRVSLRAFLRNFLQNEAIANSKAMHDFLTAQPMTLNDEERADIEKRKYMDSKRLEEQRQFFEIARQRAMDLDVHMEKFRRSVVEANGLRNLFAEIKQKEKIEDLNPEFKKFAEWLRIEVAATTYHLFLAEDNSPELFAQAKRIHGLVPYSALKQVIRFTNPAAVMSSVLDLFMAQPLGAKSLLQRIFGLALGDGIRSLQRSIDALTVKIDDPTLCDKIKNYIEGIEEVRDDVRTQAREEQVDLLVKVLQSDEIEPELSPKQIERVFNAYVAWDNAVENVDEEMRQGAELFARLKQLLKLHTRRRDKQMMLEMVEESNTLRLFRDLFQIFYEPLVRVYKSANVYNSVTDFARFADDAIQTIEKAQRQDVSADPNQTVQSFIDLCERHEEDLYKFIHEVHKHDNGLFDKLMTWIEGILDFLRNGPKGGKLDMNALFAGALEMKQIDKDKALKEINSLIKWQTARKRWHSDKTRQKMASGGQESADAMGGLASTFKPGDFGLNAMDLQDLNMEDDDDYDSEEEDDEDDADPIAAERKRRQRRQDVLKRTAGEPVKPPITELHKMNPQFLSMLRMVLAE
ncbi:hypothetical protein DOTSEDRAFT_68984 [Dothistroma septosporum NZE10]|uniref:PX domain-containing protein n=1 Tax=Dothistroma septosporum (strain NZE10 / CBS 128990) TaxID=675120 RepID=N1Q3P2_DOTSN|nr:hypothetical protein DOTSEDRAFT_68984 [Dothistroma septosporum NZE10]